MSLKHAAPGATISRPGRFVLLALVAVGFSTLSWPFLFAAIPPLTDYPNHLARFWLIVGGVGDPAMSPFYAIDWRAAVTNVGVDRVASWLGPFLPAFVIGKMAAVASCALPPLGALALNLALFRRLSPIQVLFPIAAWSTTFLMGFLNFQIGLGLALLFVAVDPLVQRRLPPALAIIRIPFGLILGADHLFALLFYAALLGGVGLGVEPIRLWPFPPPWRRLWKGAVTAAWCAVPLLIIAAHPHSLPGTQHGLRAMHPLTLSDRFVGKLATLLSPLASYNIAQELVVGCALITFFAWLNYRRALHAHGGLLLAAVGLVFLAILVPSHLAGASWIDRRFPIMALLCALSGLHLTEQVSRRFAMVIGAAAITLSSLQAAWISWNWRAMDRNMREVEAVMAYVSPGARVLPLQHSPSLGDRLRAPAGRFIFGVGDPTYRHYDALAAPLRRAFVPNLFAAHGLQPLRVLGEWDAIVEHNGGDLSSVYALGRPPRDGDASYIGGWRGHFDYVLVLNADMVDNEGVFLAPAELELVADRHFAQLWRVVRLGDAARRP